MNFLFNLTCLSVSTQYKKSNSPLFSLSNVKHYPFISVKNSFFSKLLTPIIFSYHSNAHFLIKSCYFLKIVNSVLIFETDSSFQQKEFHNSSFFENDSLITISDCIFTSINLENENKSAIISFVPINIDNSLFREIKGENGSCVNSNSSLQIKYATLKHNSGINGGCFFLCSNSIHDAIIKYSLFFQNKAKYSSIFYRKSQGDLTLSNCNISQCEATECVGVFENVGAYFNMDFSFLEKCKASVHYGGIILKKSQKISINRCTFFEIEHHSELRNSGSAIFISESKNDNIIIESQFINCINKGSYTISFEMCQSLTIYKCLFSSDFFQSVNPHSIASKIECQFDVDFVIPTSFMPNQIGFGAKKFQSPNIDILNSFLNTNKFKKQRFILMLRNISIRFIISFLFAFLIASVINYFHMQVKHTFKLKSRREKL